DATFYQGPVDDFVVRNVAFSDIALGAFYVEDTIEQAGTARLSIGDGNGFGANVAHQLVLAGDTPDAGFTDSQTGVDEVFVRVAGDSLGGPAYTTANASINAGIAEANVGGTVNVEAGTFTENVALDRQVALRGAFAGTPGDDGVRGGAGESV